MPPLEHILRNEPAIAASGIAPKHARAIQDLCKKLGWFVIFRGVNPDATPLIQDNYPTKDMGVHGKSSNWGPQAGFICLNQFFSKVVKDGKDKVIAANKDSPLSLANQYPAVPLLVSQGSLKQLVQRKKLKSFDLGRGEAVAEVPGPGMITHTFRLRAVNSDSIKHVAEAMKNLSFTTDPSAPILNPLREEEDLKAYLKNVVGTISSLASPSGKLDDLGHLYFVLTDSDSKGYPGWYEEAMQAPRYGEVLFVLASTGKGRYSRQVAQAEVNGASLPPSEGDAPFSLPLTADYDIFAICPPLKHLLGLPDREFTPPTKAPRLPPHEKPLSARWSLVKSAAKQIRSLDWSEAWGSVTPYHLYGLLRLNMAVKQAGYLGGFVCHHGTEQENMLYAEVDDVYAVFTPSGSVHAVPPKEIEFYLTDISLLGHTFYTNPSYVDVRERHHLADQVNERLKNGAEKQMGNERFDKEWFGKRPEKGEDGKDKKDAYGQVIFKKKVARGLDSHGHPIEKRVDAIYYYNRHDADLFEGLQGTDKQPDKLRLMLRHLYSEHTFLPPPNHPFSDYGELIRRWTTAMQ